MAVEGFGRFGPGDTLQVSADGAQVDEALLGRAGCLATLQTEAQVGHEFAVGNECTHAGEFADGPQFLQHHRAQDHGGRIAVALFHRSLHLGEDVPEAASISASFLSHTFSASFIGSSAAHPPCGSAGPGAPRSMI